jgi:hypothetical protein
MLTSINKVVCEKSSKSVVDIDITKLKKLHFQYQYLLAIATPFKIFLGNSSVRIILYFICKEPFLNKVFMFVFNNTT